KARQSQLAVQFAFKCEQLDLGMGVLQVIGDDLLADDGGPFQAFLGLRDDPIPHVWLGEVDGDYAAARGILVGPEVKQRPNVVDEDIPAAEVVDERRKLGVRILQIFIKNAVPAARSSVTHIHNEISAIIRYSAIDAPLGLIGALVNQYILALRC